MEKVNNEKDLSELMEKIEEAMNMTKEKQENIDKKIEELRKETAIVMVEERKKEIEDLKNAKSEFDEMTVNAIVNANNKLEEEVTETEKEYQEKLLETMEKRNTIEAKLKRMRERNTSPEKLEWAESSSKKALDKVDKEMKVYKEQHLKTINKLDNWKKQIGDWSIKLGCESKLLKVEPKTEPITEPKTEPITEPKTEPITEPKTAPIAEPKTEPTTAPTTAPTTGVKAEPKTVPTTKPKTVPTTAQKAAPEYEIVVARDAIIIFEGEIYSAKRKAVKNGVNLTDLEVKNIIKNKFNGLKLNDIEYLLNNKIMDSTVINIIENSNMEEDKKDNILKKYVKDCYLAGKSNKGVKGKICYDQEDISKTSLFARLFKKEINQEEKFELLDRARNAERYGISKLEGEYKPDIKSRILGKIFRKPVKTFLTMDEMHETALIYNDLRDNNATSNISNKQFRDRIQFNPKDINELGKYKEDLKVNSNMLEELGKLDKAQKRQEKIKSNGR